MSWLNNDTTGLHLSNVNLAYKQPLTTTFKGKTTDRTWSARGGKRGMRPLEWRPETGPEDNRRAPPANTGPEGASNHHQKNGVKAAFSSPFKSLILGCFQTKRGALCTYGELLKLVKHVNTWRSFVR